MDWYPLLNSLRIAAISAVVVFFAGIAAAYYIAKLPRLLKGILDVVLTLPLVLPPTVVGYLLLRVLGPKRLVGARDVRHPARHDVVVGHLRHGRGRLPAHVPHGARRVRGF